MPLNSIFYWDDDIVADYWERKLIVTNNSRETWMELFNSGLEAEARQTMVSQFIRETETNIQLWFEFQVQREEIQDEERAFFRPSKQPRQDVIDWDIMAEEKCVQLQQQAYNLSQLESFYELLEITADLINETLEEQKEFIMEFNALHLRSRNLRLQKHGY